MTYVLSPATRAVLKALEELRNPFQRHVDHWNRTGKCLRHYSIDIPPRFCEQCGKDWSAVVDGREGRRKRREKAAKK